MINQKPDAITRIEQDNLHKIVDPLPVEDLMYVGPATKRKLHAIGVKTIGVLAELPLEILTKKFGKMGRVLSIFANGFDATPVCKTDHIAAVKSVGNSATTPRDLTCDEDVWLMLLLLSESVAVRMRELASRCTVVEVYVRNTELQSFIRQRKLGSPTCASQEIAQTAMDLF